MQNNCESHIEWRLSRRTLLRVGGLSSALMTTGALLSLLPACRVPARQASSTPESATSALDVELALRAVEETAAILPGASTNVWRYTGEVMNGAVEAVQTMGNSYIGPILRVRKGQTVRMHFQNELPEESIIHWHGFIVPDDMDGHPGDAIATGESYVYEFEVKNRAGTYWFHPHPHGRTGPQIYQGLTGVLIVADDEEDALDLPRGDYDIPLVLQDRLFDAENQFRYLVKAESGGMMGHNMGNMGNSEEMTAMMAQMMGQRGDRILVNGQIDAELVVEARAYRLRLLNASNSRIYKLAWSDETPLTVIATGGGLLDRPLTKSYVILAPSERIDLWADFSAYEVGTELTMQSLEFSSMEMSGMMDDLEEGFLPSGAPFQVLTICVAGEAQESPVLPAQLASFDLLKPEAAINAEEPYRVELFMDDMQWTLNGRTFDLEEVQRDEKFKVNELYLWEFINLPGRGMMADFMAHPMHIHGVQFQIVERQIDPQYESRWQTLAAGIVDEGWHDTVLVAPGERVKVLMRFTQPGRFVYHCHILEHEDTGMMRNFLIDEST